MNAPTATLNHKPEAASLADRVLQLFARMLGEEYSSAELALKFQVPAAKFPKLLEEPVQLGLLAFSATEAGGAKVWHEGPHFRAWLAQQQATTGTASPPPVASAAKKPRAPHVRLKLEEVAIEVGVPLPEARPGVQGSVYKDLLEKMKPGDRVKLRARHARGLVSYAKKLRVPVAVRTVEPGIKAVWRLPAVADGGADAAANSGKPTTAATKKAARA